MSREEKCNLMIPDFTYEVLNQSESNIEADILSQPSLSVQADTSMAESILVDYMANDRFGNMSYFPWNDFP